ncbi:MAG: undecaprenyldiphospho-muramoylpentapeptide beta-N-acetylglucosaminyltransferase [Myxococcales bacterium]|nr:undecaprenyldiphospho-muramoylpentapeptide beta-N-acetylglucosaminyltransferase [Myxococcales bacterium]
MSGELRRRAERSWVVAGGGTGGHVTTALAIAERVVARGDRARILGSKRGLETRLVPAAGFEFKALPAKQLMGEGLLARIASLPTLAGACAAAWKLLGTYATEIVVSVGGYASVPAVVGAVLRGVPIAVVEPNAIPGRANLLAARFARRVFVQFDEAGRVFEARGAAGRVRNVGIPLRADLIDAFAGAPARREPAPPLRVLIFGGSQGARQINDAMIDAVGDLDPASLAIFHQTGTADRARVEEAYAKRGLAATVVEFEPDMPARYRWADVAVCRSGALTVAELALAGLPALLVPYPYAADDHQVANARSLAEVGAARILDAEPLDSAGLAGELRSLIGPAGVDALRTMSARATALARPDAAEAVVAECDALLAATSSARSDRMRER